MKIKIVLFVLFTGLVTFVSTLNWNNVEYYKRNNSVYADAFYELTLKIQGDVFVLVEYRDPINAFVSKGIVLNESNQKILTVTSKNAIWLHTGQAMTTNDYNKSVIYKLTEIENLEFRLDKLVNGKIVKSFRNRPIQPTTKISDLEKWLLGENPTLNRSFKSTNNRFNKHPKPEYSPNELKLRNEVKVLSEQNELNMHEFMNRLAERCNVGDSDSMIINFVVDPNGEIESYNFKKSIKADDEKKACVDNILTQEFINLGKVKIVPNARNGSKEKIVSYNLPVKPKK